MTNSERIRRSQAVLDMLINCLGDERKMDTYAATIQDVAGIILRLDVRIAAQHPGAYKLVDARDQLAEWIAPRLGDLLIPPTPGVSE